MPDYTEEIYERAENLFTTEAAKRNWLEGFATPRHLSGPTAYELDGIKVADALDEFESLSNNLRTAKTFSDFSIISQNAESANSSLSGRWELPVAQEVISEADFKKNEIIKSANSIKELRDLSDQAKELGDSSLSKINNKLKQVRESKIEDFIDSDTTRIKEKVYSAESLEELEESIDNVREYTETLKIDKTPEEVKEIKEIVKTKARSDFSGELDEEVRKFKEGTAQERKEAEENIRKIDPKKLGGIKSGESRRAKSALSSFFEE